MYVNPFYSYACFITAEMTKAQASCYPIYLNNDKLGLNAIT